MKKINLTVIALKQALGVFVYVFLVSLFMNNAAAVFGTDKSVWQPVAFLMLFVVSAAITGYIVLGKSVMLFLDGAKKEGVKLLMMTLGWMALIMFLVILGLIIFR